MSAPETLPALLEAQAARRPHAPAIRRKRLGIWNVLDWASYAAATREIALGLDALGVGAGDRVLLAADNCPEWLEADLAVQAAGAWSVGVYPSLTEPELAAVVDLAGARVAFCGDQEQVDKLLDCGADLSTLERIVVFDMTGLHTPEYAGAPLGSLEELRERGRGLAADRPGRYDELLAARSPGDVALVAFSSGTTGPARGALLGHAGEIALARAVVERLGVATSDRAFSLLPLAHATARLFDAYVPLVAGSTVNFPEAPETVPIDIVELAPTLVISTPRLLERIRGDVDVRIAQAGRFRLAAYRAALRAMGSPGLGRALGRLLVGRFVVAKAGLGSLRYGGIAGSFVTRELVDWFWRLGVPMRAQYGQVETGGIVSTQGGPEDVGTTGGPLAESIELRLDGDGALHVRSPGVLLGILGEESAPLRDGWYETGDLVRLDERGRVVPRARLNQLVATAAGEDVSPAEIESELKLSPYVASAVVVAAGRPFLSALLELQEEAVAGWARRHGIAVASYAALAADDRVLALVAAEVEAANGRLGAAQRVASFRILPRPLADELTPTGKIKRRVVAERFAGLLDEIYGVDAAVAESSEN